MLRKEYLGEVALLLDNWFWRQRHFGSMILVIGDVMSFFANLVSAQASMPAKIKLGFVVPPNTHSMMDLREIYTELVRRSRPSLVSAPLPRLTIRSHQHGPKYEDDGGISSHEEPEPEGSDDEDEDLNPNANLNIPPLPLSQMCDHPLHAPIQTPVLAPTTSADSPPRIHAYTHPSFTTHPNTSPSLSSAGSPSRARPPPPSHHDPKPNRAAGLPGLAGISKIL